MTIKEIAELLRAYTDEPDETFMSNDDVKAFLGQGYREFRDLITAIEPTAFSAGAAMTLSSVSFIDLATTNVTFPDTSTGTIMGASATDGKRMAHIIDLSLIGPNLTPSYIFNPVSSAAALYTTPSSYMLGGTKLLFSGLITNTLMLAYVPLPLSTTWSSLTAVTEPDDFGNFHDIIALLAYKQYAIRDGAINEVLMAQLQARLADLGAGITHRVIEAPHYVQRVMGYADRR